MCRLVSYTLYIGLLLFLARSSWQETLEPFTKRNTHKQSRGIHKSNGKHRYKHLNESLEEFSSPQADSDLIKGIKKVDTSRNTTRIKELHNSRKSIDKSKENAHGIARSDKEPPSKGDRQNDDVQDLTRLEYTIKHKKSSYKRNARSKAKENYIESRKKKDKREAYIKTNSDETRSKKQQIASFLLPRNTKLHRPSFRHTNFINPIHKYISTNGLEHRYVGAPIHRYLSKPVNIEAFTGNGLPNEKRLKDIGTLPFEMQGKPLMGNINMDKELQYIAGQRGVTPLVPDKNKDGQASQNGNGAEEGVKQLMAPLNDFITSDHSNLQDEPHPAELTKQYDDIGGYQENRFGMPIPQGFHGPNILPGPIMPTTNNLMINNRPVVHHFIRAQGGLPMAMQGSPRLVLMNRPMSYPPKRIPFMFQGLPMPPVRPRLVVVDHHHLVNGPCEENPCRNAGTCSATGTEFRCICPWGYKGDRCEVQSKCIPNPCQNFGKCTELENDYECTCHPGFHGKDCSMESKCEPNPCRSGGYCTETDDGYICSCKQGFMGKNCEQESKCHPVNPCKNNGLCKEDLMGYHCFCTDKYTGINCEANALDICENNPCVNGGSCIIDPIDSGKFTCACIPGYHGHTCQGSGECPNCPSDAQCIQGMCMPSDAGPAQEVFFGHSPCERSNPCSSGGTCVTTRYSYHCVCPINRTGRHCEVLSFPCGHCSKNGNCREDKCICNTGFVGNGFHCKHEKPHCHPNPCENGGTCHEDSNHLRRTYEANWYCECVKGYSGQRCTVFDPCTGYVCHNGGSCLSNNGEPICKCMSPFEGPTCDVDNLCLPSGGKARSVCLNGGTCQFINGQASCKCPLYYEGENCNKNKCDKCDPNARCTRGICTCKEFYIGDGLSCTLDPGHGRAPPDDDHCRSNPCLHGATCIDGKTTFYCVCPSDYYGRSCEKPRAVKVIYKDRSESSKSLCHPNPCLNGGICKETHSNDFECICVNPRYKGRFCDVDMCSECDVHARCIHGKCVCKEGYEGDGYSCLKVVDQCGGCPQYSLCKNNVCMCRLGYLWSKRSCIGTFVTNSYNAMKKEVREKPKTTKVKPTRQWSVFAEEEKPENSEALVTNERTARQTNSTQNNQYIVRKEDIIVTEYQSLGCWADSPNWKNPTSRALMSLEGLDPRVSDDYHSRKTPISMCAEVAHGLGFKMFAIQNGGQCFSGPKSRDYKRYGPSEKCKNGLGGSLANDVYKL